MASNDAQLRTHGRRARLLLAALLAIAGSSLSLATAPRVTPERPAAQSSLHAAPELGGWMLPASSPLFREIYCASDDMRRHWCSVDTRGGVQLVRQRSKSACIQGRTWGYNRNGIWVDRGCRADFEVGEGYDGGGGGGRQEIYCASDDMRRHWCSVNTRGGVRLVRQRSKSACIQGSTWGYNRDGIWVDRGCRADFVAGRY